jgi:inner membrane transporter RhtA
LQYRGGDSGVVPSGQQRSAPIAAVPPSVLVCTGIVSVQLGAGLAARLFSQVSPAGVTGLRLWSAAIILTVLGGRALASSVRRTIADRAWRDAAVVLTFGLVLGLMNYSIYQSFARIPLGIAVTIEFLGPLAVAVASSRRRLDLLWVALAGLGVALLTHAGTGVAATAYKQEGGVPGLGLEATGVVFGLIAAASWAAYILLSRSTGRRYSGSSGLGIAMVVGAIVVTGPALAAGGPAMAHPRVIATGAAIGLLSSVIPYRLELEALRRIPARVFGIWMSLEPAVAALIGLLLLGQSLSALQWLAICCVIVACAGASREGPAQPQA